MSNSPCIRTAIIGISGYGRIHLGLARDAAPMGLILSAAVVINPHEEQANVQALRESGCRIYSNYEEMMREESGRIDLCLIPTGIAWHARMTLAALRARMNVLVEKPLAASVAEVREIQAEAARIGCFVAVGFQDIYAPAAHDLKRRLLDGVIGPIQSVRLLGLWPRPASYFSRNSWAGKLSADGALVLDSPLNNAFAHFVNLGLFFAGCDFASSAEVRDVEAVLWRTNPIESFDTGVVRACTPDGIRLWFGVSHASPVNQDPEIVIQGTRGQIVWRHDDECVIEAAGATPETIPLVDTSVTRADMMRAVIRRFSDPATFICTPEIALRQTELVARVHEAAEIVPAPGGVARVAGPDGREEMLSSPGLAEILQRAFHEQILPLAVNC
jgi:predicted dehydrogenase